jgi:hypothetical protein
MRNVICLNEVRKNKAEQARNQETRPDYAYHAAILGMDRLELVAEMVRFQEERVQSGLTPDLIARGLILFKALETSAETPALQNLARSYRRDLNYQARTFRSE